MSSVSEGPRVECVRDRLWLWGHLAGSHNGRFGLSRESQMTPAAGAAYLGVTNLIMVAFGGMPEPPLEPHAQALSSLKRVVWSIIGDSSSSRNDERTDLEEVISLADRYPNITGAIMDDFFQFRNRPPIQLREAWALENNLRGGETVLARYGGEEFCIVMPGVGKEKAVEILERLRGSLSQNPFLYKKEGLNIHVTSSFGVSGYPEDDTTREGLIEKSDAALYTAKRMGRNRVVLFGEEVPSRAAER